MNIINEVKNYTLFFNKYKNHQEAAILACYFNPENSPYRLRAFMHFYQRIKHLNCFILECIIGNGNSQIGHLPHVKTIQTSHLLWHKEALLNKLIRELPPQYKYIFWLDADIIFTNKNWLVESVKVLKHKKIIQPFSHCVHLEKDQLSPNFSMDFVKKTDTPNKENSKVWSSFCYNFATSELWQSFDYHTHGHVGMAWGAQREVLTQVPLYERALIGGADHIIAHASTGQIPHRCIIKAFKSDIAQINLWSKKFYNQVQGKVGFVSGNLYHIWHGDLEKRQYYRRILDFTEKSKSITQKDDNGLYILDHTDDPYLVQYFKDREVKD